MDGQKILINIVCARTRQHLTYHIFGRCTVHSNKLLRNIMLLNENLVLPDLCPIVLHRVTSSKYERVHTVPDLVSSYSVVSYRAMSDKWVSGLTLWSLSWISLHLLGVKDLLVPSINYQVSHIITINWNKFEKFWWQYGLLLWSRKSLHRFEFEWTIKRYFYRNDYII